MHITHVVLNLECGGLEHLTIDLAAHLKELGHTSEIICLAQKGELASIAEGKGIRVTSLGKTEGFDKSMIKELAKLFKESKTDVVHTHNMAPLIYASPAALLAGKKCVNTRHGREAKKTSMFIWAMNKFVAAVSNDAKEEMLKHNRINKSKVRVIYNGIDTDRFNDKQDFEDNKNFRKSIGIGDDTFIIGTVGRLAKEKDHETMIKAFHKLMKKKMNGVLVIVGDGPLKEPLQKLAGQLDMADKVKFLGYRDDVSQIMKSFNVYIMSSFMEGVSLTLLEAMASGKPVVATKVGGNPEVVLENHTGYLVPCGFPERMEAAIMRLYVNRKIGVEMGEAGRKRVEETFSLKKMANEYVELYKG